MKHFNKKTIIISVIILFVIAFALVAGRTVLRSGLFYEKGVHTPIRLLSGQEQYSGETDSNELDLIDSSGMTMNTRILTPDGFTRTKADDNSLLDYMRRMELLKDGSKVKLYNGKELDLKPAAVFAFDIGNQDLQQCADSIIRIYSEYLWSQGRTDEISFSLTNGLEVSYSDWKDGKRLLALSNIAFMMKMTGKDDSYDCFAAYMDKVMNYAGTKSFAKEGTQIKLEDLKPGDMLLSDTHVVLVVDEAKNEKGEKCWLMAQGYMPAQSFHIMTNPLHKDDPWYYETEMEGQTIVKTIMNSFYDDDYYRWKVTF